jgi:beta-lactamase regulating signal transducer with metallopeptidase domain
VVTLFGPLLLSPADSARAVAQVYSVSILATIPLAIAGGAALVLHRAAAGTRALVWRCAALALVIVYLGHSLSVQPTSWTVPGILAAPLVALGRVEVSGTSAVSWMSGGPEHGMVLFVWMLLLVYVIGVGVGLVSLARDWLVAYRLVARATEPSSARWLALLDDARATLGIRRVVRVLCTSELGTPATCGSWRPVVLLPAEAQSWSDHRVRLVLLHELAHVKRHDVAFALVARLACALYWFHPAAWFVARELHDECEMACDECVVAAGVRPSDYLALLVDASSAALGIAPDSAPMFTAFTGRLRHRRGLGARLRAIGDATRTRRAPQRPAVLAAAVLTILVAVPVSLAQLAPTRDVLTRLMRDDEWDARAYAVIGLARRPDSVAVVRSAAVLDPNPRVRALAEAALPRR